MSERDKGLLRAAHLKPAEAAFLLGRSPAAVYTGLSRKERHYFGPSMASMFLRCLYAKASPTAELQNFIEQNYPAECDLILPDRINNAQLVERSKKSDFIAFGFNPTFADIETLSKNSSLIRAVTGTLEHHPEVTFITNQKWVSGCVADRHPDISGIHYVISEEYDYPFTFARLHPDFQPPSAFIFGMQGPAEMRSHDAFQLEKYLRSRALLENHATRDTVHGTG